VTAVALADDGDGSFESNAQDFWSTEPSGNDVKKGGAAGLLDPTKRNLYVDLGGSLVSFTTENAANLPNSLFERVVVALSSINVGLNATIALATGQINTQVALWWYDCDGNYHTELPIGGLGALTGLLQCHITVDDALKLKYIQFARGYDRNVNGDITAGYRKHMGDILHSKPVVYEYLNEQGRIKGRTVFVGTNEGYLHAIDADTGLEKWAFMPQSLLKNIGIFFDNTETLKHVYGVDGQIRIWVNDADKNGQIVYNSETGEGVYLIFSLGRGGAYYYALNITDPDKPYLQWSIYPNKGDKFTELGESWSKPALAYMRVKKSTDDTATIKPVFVFGAGYDPVKDEADASKRLADQKGRDVYIIDALTGDLIWSLRGSSSNSPLTHSVPSDIRVLDMNHDGALDRLYFADTGGYVWRVDIDKVSSDSNYIDPLITQFADLGGDNNTGGRRMFFSEPDVALQLNQGTPVLTIALGSGYRMHPLSTSISDRFYVLKDENVYSLPTEDTAILKEEVNVKPLSSLANKSLLDSSFKGWYMPLRFNGEKSLSRALTFMGKIIFTTFALTDENGQASTNDGCTKTVTTSRVYMLDLMSGEPLADLNRDGKGKDEFIVITNGDILETPQIVFQTPKSVDGRDCSLGNCEQAVEIRVGKLKLPLLDKSNTGNTNLLDSVDLSRVVPRVYWLNMNVSPQHP
jgi:outer membrane protein assembly factor BamB